MFFWKSFAFSTIHRMLAIWSLVPLENQLEHQGVHGSHIAEACLGEFWALLYYHVRWVQLCGSLSILWHCLSLGLEWKSRKSRNTWSNRQIWPWNTEWSRAKTNRVLPREHTGHSKHPLPTTHEKTLHMDITRWSTPKQYGLGLIYLSPNR